ncbi:hypothetical protein MRX96_017776 [Rhipicephalus microplus]
MSLSCVATSSGQWLGPNEHIGGTRDDSGEVACSKNPDDRAVGLTGGPGSRVTAGAAMISDVAAEEAARLVCHKTQCKAYLSACSTDVAGPVDQKFQAAILGCTADDQKKTRRRLEAILASLPRRC